MKRPLFVFCTGIIAAQILKVYLPQHSFGMLLAIFILCAILSVVARRKLGIALCFVGVVFGILMFNFSNSKNTKNINEIVNSENADAVTITAVVQEVQNSYMDGKVIATLDVKNVDGKPLEFGAICYLFPTVKRGQIVEAVVDLSSLPKDFYLIYQYSNGVFAEISQVRSYKSLGEVDGVYGFCINLQRELSANIRELLPEKEGGILTAMTVGDTSHLQKSVKEIYSRAGVSHILVVSGMHLSLICGMFAFKQKSALRRKTYAIICVFVALLLMMITGFTPSIVRASFVLIITSTAVFLSRRNDSLTSLSLAGMLLLLENGWVVASISYQLSFMATLGVLFGVNVYNSFVEKNETRAFFAVIKPVFAFLAVTIGAFIGTFPVLVLQGFNISMVSILANIPVFLLSGIILICGFGVGVCALFPFVEILSLPFALVGGVLIKGTNAYVEKLASLPYAQVKFETKFALVVLVILISFIYFALKSNASYKAIFGSVCILILTACILTMQYNKDLVRISLVGESTAPAVVITQNDDTMVLFRGTEEAVSKVYAYLDKRNIFNIEFVADMRYNANSKTGLTSAFETSIEKLPLNQEVFFMVGDVAFTLYNAKSGAMAAFDVGGVSFATISGKFKTFTPVPIDVLLANSSTPTSVLPEIIFSLKENFNWVENMQQTEFIYAQEDAEIWLYPGGKLMFKGA